MQAGKSRKKAEGENISPITSVLGQCDKSDPVSTAPWKLDLVILILSYNISLVLLCYFSEGKGWMLYVNTEHSVSTSKISLPWSNLAAAP